MNTPEHCPACGVGLVAARWCCSSCGWRLITREEWQALTPFRQGYALYMQGSWEASEIKKETNPYEEGTSAWKKFREGEQTAMLDVQDGEE